MNRAIRALARWTAVLALSLVIASPLVIAATLFGIEFSMESFYQLNGRPPLGEKDIGVGLVGLGTTGMWLVGSFVVLWPLSTIAAYFVVRRVEYGQWHKSRVILSPARASDDV